jgi:DMSO/TMAO reductase YedYZ heme-binding membrane subunit
MVKKKTRNYKNIVTGLLVLSYLIPLIVLFSNFSPTTGFILRGIGLIAFTSIFVQIMLGSFRPFFNKTYDSVKIYWFHNYLGLITLVLALVHAGARSLLFGVINTLLLNTNLAVNLGMIALYFMVLTVGTSDLKFFFKVKIGYNFWRMIHLLNYILFILVYVHAVMIGTEFNSIIMIFAANAFLALSIFGMSFRLYVGFIKKKN